MKKPKRKPKIKNTILFTVIGMSYPIIKAIASDTGKMLHFLDSLTIIGLVYLFVGIFESIYLHGDFDSIGFRIRHPKLNDNASFETYKENLKKKREESFNYPLFCGLFFIVLSYFLATFFY